MKKQILALLSQKLAEEIQSLEQIQLTTAKAATEEENRAENEYDTRSTEAAYLAAGQAQRLEGMKQAFKIVTDFPVKNFSEDSPVALGALLTLHSNNELQYYFLLPVAGGYKIIFQNQTIQVVTPQSLLGRELLGKGREDEVEILVSTKKRIYTIASIK